MAIEDARFVLPNACATKLICTFNARSLLHFFSLRLCNRAQWEIRNLATQMLKTVLPVAPILFKNAGPPCFGSLCPEGKMCCGKQKEVKTFFEELHKTP
jgi:thymidylate synthase (FAD)